MDFLGIVGEQNIKLLWGKNKLVGQKMQHEFFKTLCAAFHSNMVSISGLVYLAIVSLVQQLFEIVYQETASQRISCQ